MKNFNERYNNIFIKYNSTEDKEIQSLLNFYYSVSDKININLLREIGLLLSELDKDNTENYNKFLSLLKTEDKFIGVNNATGSGKTTSYRKFIVENTSTTSGVLSLSLLSHLKKLFFHIISQIISNFKTDRLNKLTNDYLRKILLSKVRLFIEDDFKKFSFSDLSSSNWILITHNRLIIEPPAILYQKLDFTTKGKFSNRQYLLIDEFPTNLYESYDLGVQLRCKNWMESINKLKSENDSSEDITYKLLNSIDKSELEVFDTNYQIPFEKIPNNFKYICKNEMPKISGLTSNFLSINSSLSKNKQPQSEELLDYSNEYRIRRLAYKIGKIYDKGEEYKSKHGEYPNYIHLSYLDYHFNKIIIFDGTLNLSIKNSQLFKFYKWKDYNLKLKSNLKYINYKFDKTSNTLLVKNLISKILNLYDIKKLLIYGWKDLNIDTEDLEKSLNTDRVKYFYYQSGEERVTSEYSDCDSILILGNFKIPNLDIDLRNKLFQSESSNNDNNLALVIQSIYRTKARLNEEITIFSLLDNELNSKLLNYMNSSKLDIEDITNDIIENSEIDEKLYFNEFNSLRTLIDYTVEIIDNNECFKFKKSDLIRELNINPNSKNKNRDIEIKLKNIGVKVIKITNNTNQYSMEDTSFVWCTLDKNIDKSIKQTNFAINHKLDVNNNISNNLIYSNINDTKK